MEVPAFVCCVFSIYFVTLIPFAASQKFEQVTDKLGDTLHRYVRDVTAHEAITKAYGAQLPVGKGSVSYQPLDLPTLTSKMASTLDRAIFEPKLKALQDSVAEAEKLAAQHSWDGSLKIKDVSYVNSKLLNDTGYEHSVLFNQPVNGSSSSVHIPVEIYNGNINILNSLQWTGGLDEVWRRNRQRSPDLLWQYFGSQDGFIRIFPGSKWRRGSPDMYDVRRRPWYTAGSSSPKDMVILIDRSGSTFGQAIQLMKISVNYLMDTIGENDYVTIIQFNQEPEFVLDCLKTRKFLRATYWNKKALYDAVRNISAHGMADYNKAFAFAFEQLREFRSNTSAGRGADCNQVIMVLSDGTQDKPEDVFNEYNEDNRVRVFTYAVGPTVSDVQTLEWMACRNKGYFSKIYAMGAIMTKVQEYLPVVGRPLSLSRTPWKHWSLRYDTTSPERRGLGMMTTLTLPVYNLRSDSLAANQSILGVMGVDVLVGDLTRRSPSRHVLGPNGYAFAIDNNGYVVFHPGLKAPLGWLTDPPNSDLLDVEIADQTKRRIRQEMISMKTGSVRVSGPVLYPGERYQATSDRVYTYHRIPNTDFSLALVTPANSLTGDAAETIYPDIFGFNVSASALKLEEILNSGQQRALFVAPWLRCSINDTTDREVTTNGETTTDRETDAAGNATDTPRDEYWAVRILIAGLKTGQCDVTPDLIQHLSWDLHATDPTMTSHWGQLTEEQRNHASGHFVATSGGLTLMSPSHINSSLVDHSDPVTAEYYQRALDSDVYVYSTPYQTGPGVSNSTWNDVMVARAVRSSGYRPAVVGAMVKQEYMAAIMTSADPRCSEMATDPNDCFLLDEGGFIVTTNVAGQIGKFYAEVDDAVMSRLVLDGMYIQRQRHDYQAACAPAKRDGHSSAGPRHRPLLLGLYEMMTDGWWSNKLSWAYLHFNLYSWLTGSQPSMGVAGAGVSSPKNHSCVRLHYRYEFGENTSASGEIDCECQTAPRRYQAGRLSHSNLVLVSVDHQPSCCTRPARLPHGAVEVLKLPSPCSREERFRKRPNDCWQADEQEDVSDCNGSHVISYSVLLALLTILRYAT